MDNSAAKNNVKILRLLPSIDTLLITDTARELINKVGIQKATELARIAADSLRGDLQKLMPDEGNNPEHTREGMLSAAENLLRQALETEQKNGLRRMINATGVIIHTNLGRAPLSENARIAMIEKAARYCSLEYDIKTASRGKRGSHTENLLVELTGAESALIVNNCAAAAVLVLTALCKDKEAIVSRGELVEIGGDFRVPDVMTQSGAELVEVGTTNRTKILDYQQAISDKTGLILKVHPSNYRIIGFTSKPGVRELADLAHEKDVLLYEDAGSGALFDLSEYGLGDEPIIGESIKSGADVVTFSGDKLLGGIQAGLIVGRKKVIEKLRKHPLYRALRASKLIYAALEATLESFRKGTAINEIPVLKMLSMSYGELKSRTKHFAEQLREKLGQDSNLHFEIVDGESVVGGGSAPGTQPKTILLSLKLDGLSVNDLEKKLRLQNTPVAARILNDSIVIDLRTVSENEENELLEVLIGINTDMTDSEESASTNL